MKKTKWNRLLAFLMALALVIPMLVTPIHADDDAELGHTHEETTQPEDATQTSDPTVTEDPAAPENGEPTEPEDAGEPTEEPAPSDAATPEDEGAPEPQTTSEPASQEDGGVDQLSNAANEPTQEAVPAALTQPVITVIPDYSYLQNSLTVTMLKGPTKENVYCHGVTVYVAGATSITVTKDGGQPEAQNTSTFTLGGSNESGFRAVNYVIQADDVTLAITVYPGHFIGGRDTYIGDDGKSQAVTRCVYCGAFYDYFKPTTPSVDSDGHDYTEKVIDGTTSCDGKTYIIKTCEDCGYMTVEVSGDGNGTEHSWVGKRKDASCKDYGAEYQECAECGAVKEGSIKLLGKTGHALKHTNVIYSYPNDDCTQGNGTEKVVCSICGETIERTLARQSQHNMAWTVTKKATCGADGEQTGKCRNPGCKYTETKTYTAPDNEHTWNDGVVIKQPTCDEPGTKRLTCSACGTTKEEEIAKLGGEHDYVIIEEVEATCTTQGHRTKTCTKCQKVETEILPIDPDHHTSPGDDGLCTTPVICTLCGKAIVEAKTHVLGKAASKDENVHVRKCTNPDCTYSEETQHFGTDDGTCFTALFCADCGRILRPGYSFHAGGKLVPLPSNPEEKHTYQCTHDGCEQYYGQVNSHTFVDNVCTGCGYTRVVHEHELEYRSDPNGHWLECKTCHVREGDVQPHSRTVEQGYEGTCLNAVTCTVCGYTILHAQTDHTYPSEWQQTDEYHYHKCTQNGCDVTENFVHHANPDGNCTTDDVCQTCGYVVVHGGAEHAMYLVAGSGTEAGHQRECTNEGCDYTDFINHDGSTQGTPATCSKQATCLYCGASYGALDPENHDGERITVGYVEPTYDDPGYSGDIVCSNCDQIIEKGKELPKREHGNDHVYDDDYAYEEEGHYRVCSICGTWDMDSFEEHTYAYLDNGDGSHTKYCTVCAYEKLENHHYHDNHDCTTEVKCEECDAVVIEASGGHNFDGRAVPVLGGDGHQVACTNRDCTKMSDVVPHTGGQANCQTPAHCEVCGEGYGEMNPKVHAGGTEIKNHKDPTETEEGYSGDLYCSGCGVKLEDGHTLDKLPVEHEHSFDRYDHDEHDHWMECECGAFTEKEPHDYGDYQSDDTRHWKECVCGLQTEVGEHTYVNGKCSVCGKAQPGGSPIVPLPDVRPEPTKPSQPDVTNPTTKPSDVPKTGDATPLLALMGMLFLSGAGILALLAGKRRRK